jgi:uncharacterized membrane protein YdjX (TVP38/TMEM64 family)
MPSRVLKRPTRLQLTLAFLVVVLLGFAAFLLLPHLHVADLKAALHWVSQLCASVPPLVFVLFFAVLPYVGVPTSLLYVAAAGAYHPTWHAVGWSWFGLALNILLGHFLGRWLRGPITRLLARRGWRLPEVPARENWRLILLTRILPGLPLAAQNLLLAVANVPLPIYLFISLPVQMLFALGLVLSGGALFDGNIGLLFAGLCLLVALALFAHVAKNMYEARRRAAAHAAPRS